jgi:hypothetical protein
VKEILDRADALGYVAFRSNYPDRNKASGLVGLYIDDVYKAIHLAGATGTDPAASFVTGRLSNQLKLRPRINRSLLLPVVPFCAFEFPKLPENAAVTGHRKAATNRQYAQWMAPFGTLRYA